MTSPQIDGGPSDRASSRSRRPRRAQGERGLALVEFAIILPLLLMLILGLFSGGLAYNQKLDLTHAAREGARYGASIPTDQVWANGQTWAQNIRLYVVDRSDGTLVAGDVCVTLVEGNAPVTVSAATRTQATPCVADSYPSYHVTNDRGRRVQVHVRRQGEIELGILPSFTFPMTSDAVAKSESNL